ncbi:uncharacterized protein LOC135221306 [Macrobrachium nipponense]|uniref:uncharacterized protein LOC135221306 n=1 Tax=Macrobrachium nipponense TaxID=159736 RepID=UPI0030C850E6
MHQQKDVPVLSSRHGFPDSVYPITSPRAGVATTFTSRLWMSPNLLSTQLHQAATYHTESNGVIEIFHRTLKAAFMSRCNSSNWYSQLHWVLGLQVQTTPKESFDLSAAEMVYGDPLVIPGKFLHDDNTSPRYHQTPDHHRKIHPLLSILQAKREDLNPEGFAQGDTCIQQNQCCSSIFDPALHWPHPGPQPQTESLSRRHPQYDREGWNLPPETSIFA